MPKIIVEGFKSIGARTELELAGLTILAGANSSGKSSVMQALLLLKQTLEADYDPGPLLLNGPHVRFNKVDQFLHTSLNGRKKSRFVVGFDSGSDFFETQLEYKSGELRVEASSFSRGDAIVKLTREGTDLKQWESEAQYFEVEGLPDKARLTPHVELARFALTVMLESDGSVRHTGAGLALPNLFWLRRIIHLPGLRGHPERSYPKTNTGPNFRGTFENYTASVLNKWRAHDHSRFESVAEDLTKLGLTNSLEVTTVDDAFVEIRVGRQVRKSPASSHTVNIADVGIGVSQVLPVVVALHQAEPGQLVYIEQPELHLHPRAQVALAGLLADAAQRGSLVVIETHSSLLLLAVQTLVAQRKLDANDVRLHWFERDDVTGVTRVTSREVDEFGRFGDWPADFDDVSLSAERQYLDAAQAALARVRPRG